MGMVRGVSDSNVSTRIEAERYISSDPCRSDGCRISYDIPEGVSYHAVVAQELEYTFQADRPNDFDQ